MTTWRPATPHDAEALRDLERVSSQAGLSHIFGDLQYPDDDVLARWRETLEEVGVTTEVVHDDRGLLAFTTFDQTTLRHLGVRPDAWGSGLGRQGVARAVEAGVSRLWVLEENYRARRLYEALRWATTGESRACPWSPYPTEVEYVAPHCDQSQLQPRALVEPRPSSQVG